MAFAPLLPKLGADHCLKLSRAASRNLLTESLGYCRHSLGVDGNPHHATIPMMSISASASGTTPRAI